MENPEKSIKRLLHRPDVEKMSMPKDYLKNARFQYQNLLLYLKKLKEQYPDKAKTLQKKEKPETKAHTMDFTQDKEIFILCRVLQMTEAKEEWNELHNLLNARFLLKELQKDNHPLPTHHFMPREQMAPHTMKLQKDNIPLQTHQSMHTEKMTPHTTKSGAKESTTSSEKQTMGTVLGSEFNNPTLQNIEGRHPSQSYTQPKDISDLQETQHGFQVEPGRQKPEQPTKTGKSEIQQRNKTDKPGNQQTDGEANSLGMSKNISDPQKTFQRFPQESRRHKPEQSTGKHEYQQTDSTSGDTINAGCKVERPILLLLSREKSQEAEKEYRRLLDNQKMMFDDRQIVQPNVTWETSTDIGDITDEQKKKSAVLYDYLKKAFEKIKDESQDLVKRALSEFIVLTGASYDRPTDKKRKGATAAPNFPKNDVPSTSVGDVNKISQSEYANLKPIQKALNKLKLICTNTSDLIAAERQYYQLIKRDDNFKRRFPEQHRELQVFMTDPEECDITSYKALYSALRRLQKTDPLYREAWEEFFFIITSEQQFIIAESCGKLTKTVYNKHSDTMVIPRKSYEELQNELVEKIKQIDELTSRLSKFASQQLTAGNPNIADLSDKHRPTKIGEFYSELYDNEWSEAFEVIKPLEYPNTTEDPDTEYFEEVLRILKNILMAAYEFSAERTEKHLEDIKLTLLGTITDQEIDKAKGTEYDRFVTEYAMKYRKEAAAYAIKMASKVFKPDGFQKFLKQKSEDPKLLAYVDKCVELTWYMRIQDPPMHLHCLQEKETISKTEFAFHGRKGKTTLVCVWPALLLFEGGHLVTKGHVLPAE